MTDANTSVKNALTDLRDAADEQGKTDNPDLRVIGEKFENFRQAWVEAKDAELAHEANPDGDTTEVEIDEKVEADKPAARKTSTK